MEPTTPHKLFSMLDSENPEERLTAIQILSEAGDAEALAAQSVRTKVNFSVICLRRNTGRWLSQNTFY